MTLLLLLCCSSESNFKVTDPRLDSSSTLQLFRTKASIKSNIDYKTGYLSISTERELK